MTHRADISGKARLIEVIAVAARRLADRRWGALIVLERDTGLNEYVFEAQVSPPPPASPTPPQQLIQVNRLRLVG